GYVEDGNVVLDYDLFTDYLDKNKAVATEVVNKELSIRLAQSILGEEWVWNNMIMKNETAKGLNVTLEKEISKEAMIRLYSYIRLSELGIALEDFKAQRDGFYGQGVLLESCDLEELKTKGLITAEELKNAGAVKIWNFRNSDSELFEALIGYLADTSNDSLISLFETKLVTDTAVRKSA
ncbi:hypothetical protein KKC59_03310, partial [bacterium]|nr:hypothetical protein [bacterium]